MLPTDNSYRPSAHASDVRFEHLASARHRRPAAPALLDRRATRPAGARPPTRSRRGAGRRSARRDRARRVRRVGARRLAVRAARLPRAAHRPRPGLGRRRAAVRLERAGDASRPGCSTPATGPPGSSRPTGTRTRRGRSPARCCAASSTSAAGAGRARLYVTALGVYEAEINGAVVGDHVLAPGWTSYEHRLRYQTFDVTDLLREGRTPSARARRRLVPRPARLRRRPAQPLRRPPRAARPARDRLRRRHDRARRHRRVLARADAARSWRATSTTARPTTPAWSGPAGRRRATTTRTGRASGCSTATWRRSSRRRPAGPPHRDGRAGRDHARRPRAARSSTSARTSSAGCGSTVQGPAGQTITLRHAEVLEDGELCTRPLRARAGDRPLHPAGRRTRDLGAALHLPRLPLRRGRRLAGRR